MYCICRRMVIAPKTNSMERANCITINPSFSTLRLRPNLFRPERASCTRERRMILDARRDVTHATRRAIPKTNKVISMPGSKDKESPVSLPKRGVNCQAMPVAIIAEKKLTNVDSTINCHQSCKLFAPSVLRTPISRNRPKA